MIKSYKVFLSLLEDFKPTFKTKSSSILFHIPNIIHCLMLTFCLNLLTSDFILFGFKIEINQKQTTYLQETIDIDCCFPFQYLLYQIECIN